MKKQYKIGLYEKSMPNTLSIKEKLLLTKKLNYDFLELSIDETNEKLNRLQLTNEDIKDLIIFMNENDIYIESICLSALRKYPFGSLDDNTRLKSLEITEKAIILASKLGVRYIQLAGYDVYYEESNEQTKINFINTLKNAVEIASKYGVILAFETMENEFMDTISKSNYYVSLINSPFLKIYPDIGNLTNASKKYNVSVKKDFSTGSNNIIALHLKEAREGVYRDLIVGDGYVNFNEAIKLARKYNIFRFVTELWYSDENTYISNINKTYNSLISIISEVYNNE